MLMEDEIALAGSRFAVRPGRRNELHMFVGGAGLFSRVFERGIMFAFRNLHSVTTAYYYNLVHCSDVISLPQTSANMHKTTCLFDTILHLMILAKRNYYYHYIDIRQRKKQPTHTAL